MYEMNDSERAERASLKSLHTAARAEMAQSFGEARRYALLVWGFIRGLPYRRIERSHRFQCRYEPSQVVDGKVKKGKRVLLTREHHDVDDAGMFAPFECNLPSVYSLTKALLKVYRAAGPVEPGLEALLKIKISAWLRDPSGAKQPPALARKNAIVFANLDWSPGSFERAVARTQRQGARHLTAVDVSAVIMQPVELSMTSLSTFHPRDDDEERGLALAEKIGVRVSRVEVAFDEIVDNLSALQREREAREQPPLDPALMRPGRATEVLDFPEPVQSRILSDREVKAMTTEVWLDPPAAAAAAKVLGSGPGESIAYDHISIDPATGSMGLGGRIVVLGSTPPSLLGDILRSIPARKGDADDYGKTLMDITCPNLDRAKVEMVTLAPALATWATDGPAREGITIIDDPLDHSPTAAEREAVKTWFDSTLGKDRAAPQRIAAQPDPYPSGAPMDPYPNRSCMERDEPLPDLPVGLKHIGGAE